MLLTELSQNTLHRSSRYHSYNSVRKAVSLEPRVCHKTMRKEPYLNKIKFSVKTKNKRYNFNTSVEVNVHSEIKYRFEHTHTHTIQKLRNSERHKKVDIVSGLKEHNDTKTEIFSFSNKIFVLKFQRRFFCH